MDKNLINFVRHILEEDFASANTDLKKAVDIRMKDRVEREYSKVKSSHNKNSN